MLPFLTVIFLSLVGVLGDSFIKSAGQNARYEKIYFCIGALLYASTAFGWLYAMKHYKLGVLGVIYAVTTTMALILIDAAFFNETITFHEVIGILLGILSLVVLNKLI